MGSEVKTHWGASGRDEMLWFDPEVLVLVEDKSHVLYDGRVSLKLDDNMIKNVMRYGILQPVTVRRNGEKNGKPNVEVVAGRQRVRWAREANKRLVAEGKEPIRVPAVRRRGDEGDLVGVMISENEVRQEEDIVSRAQKLSRYLAMGRTEEEAAVTFGCTQQTIKNILQVLDLDTSVQKLVRTGKMPMMVAKELAAMPKEEQEEALAKLVESGELKGARGVEAAKKVRNGHKAESDTVRVMHKKSIAKWLDSLKEVRENDEVRIGKAILARILGKERALSGYSSLKEALDGAE